MFEKSFGFLRFPDLRRLYTYVESRQLSDFSEVVLELGKGPISLS